jgi:hypothetical protein
MHVSFSIMLEWVTTPPQVKELASMPTVVVCAVVAAAVCTVFMVGCAVVGCVVYVVRCAVIRYAVGINLGVYKSGLASVCWKDLTDFAPMRAAKLVKLRKQVQKRHFFVHRSVVVGGALSLEEAVYVGWGGPLLLGDRSVEC